MFLRVGRWVGRIFRNRPVWRRLVARSLIAVALLQGEIMRDAEDPAAKVSPGLACLKVAEERQKHFLYDFFRIVHGYAKRKRVTQKRVAKLLE
jgi:hypothetical protein